MFKTIERLAHQTACRLFDLKDHFHPFGDDDNEPTAPLIDPLIRLVLSIETMAYRQQRQLSNRQFDAMLKELDRE
jgi:hypothetical protein